MKEFIKHNPATLDNVETMANAMIESMRFVDNTLDYPEAEKARPNDGVEPEWFYDAYYGAIPTSELTAIIQYTQQRMLFENIGETFRPFGRFYRTTGWAREYSEVFEFGGYGRI